MPAYRLVELVAVVLTQAEEFSLMPALELNIFSLEVGSLIPLYFRDGHWIHHSRELA
jgi:hypothetical protein